MTGEEKHYWKEICRNVVSLIHDSVYCNKENAFGIMQCIKSLLLLTSSKNCIGRQEHHILFFHTNVTKFISSLFWNLIRFSPDIWFTIFWMKDNNYHHCPKYNRLIFLLSIGLVCSQSSAAHHKANISDNLHRLAVLWPLEKGRVDTLLDYGWLTFQFTFLNNKLWGTNIKWAC